MSRTKLLVIFGNVLVFAICGVRTSLSTTADDAYRAFAGIYGDGDRMIAARPESPSAPRGQQQFDTPMATAERLERSGWWPTKGTARREDFVGTAQCARCHRTITQAQLTTPMARAASSAADSSILLEHTRLSLRVEPYTYVISGVNGRSNYSVSDAVGAISEPLGWAFGAGTKGQTYVFTRGGLYYESRMSFYENLEGLDLTTGHSPASPRNLEEALGRVLDRNTVQQCFGCHTTASTTLAGFDPAHLTVGVACEACHGPGAAHRELMENGDSGDGRAAIFNPARLSPVALVDFCGACHRTMNDVYEMGAMGATGVSNVRFQPYRLENSKCWGVLGDARLACTACHDPHQPLVRDAGSYDQKCLACHSNSPSAKRTRERPGKACPVAKRDCTNCHMPRVTVPSMHAPFVDHRIRIVRANEGYPE